MKVSKQVEDSVKDAISNLRNALAFAARTEEPYISKHIADILLSIDTIKETHQYLSNIKDIMGEREDK